MFLIDIHPSTTNRSYTKPEWILVSHHPHDAITILAGTPPDSDVDDISPNLMQKKSYY